MTAAFVYCAVWGGNWWSGCCGFQLLMISRTVMPAGIIGRTCSW